MRSMNYTTLIFDAFDTVIHINTSKLPTLNIDGKEISTTAPAVYEAYTGPKRAELNAVKASATLTSSGNFVLTGTNQGRINKAPAVYVWGIDRNGNLSPGPFNNRPDIKFDALVIVSFDSSLTPTAKVIDLASGATTNLPSSSVHVHGRTVSVTVPGSLLPSTGLAPSQFRFNYWPEDGGPRIGGPRAGYPWERMR